MNHAVFTSLLASRLYPLLRAEGFRGTGSTLRRVNAPVVHIFNVQAASTADRCYLNLGAHLTFLPPEGGQVVEPQHMKENHCAFRTRVNPPQDQAFGWSYGASEAETRANVERVLEAWKKQAKPYFASYGDFPAGFLTLIAGATPATAHPANALTLARVALELGNREAAKALVSAALERISPGATGLQYDLTQVLRAANAT